MKIIQLASGDLWAGAEVQLFHLASALNRVPDLSLLVVLLNHGQLEQELIAKGVTVKVVDESKLSSFKISKELYSIAKDYQPDIIHTHRIKENTIGGLVAKLIRCKTVRTVHGAEEKGDNRFDLKKIVLSTLDSFYARFVQDKIIPVSDELEKKLSKIYPQKKIFTIYNSVDIKYIQNRANQEIDTGIDPNHINIGFVGRFVPVKRVGLFCDIAKNVVGNSSSDNVHFYMIGDGPEFEEIKNRLEKEGLTNRIHLVGFVENSAPYIAQLDCLLFTSEHEGLPMTLLEAMALETVVFATGLPTIKQVLQGEKGGCFPNTSEPYAFADVLIQKIENIHQLKQKAKVAKTILIEKYSLETNIEKFLQLYQSIL